MKDTRNRPLPERALVVGAPFARLICEGVKTWEMRSAETHVRGRVGIIQTGTGLIIGEATLVDCLEPVKTMTQAKATQDKHRVEDLSLLRKWSVPWLLKDAELYDEPIPYDHPRGAVVWVKLKQDIK